MAYRFNGTSDYVQFAISPFSGHTFGALTYAVFLNRTSNNITRNIIEFTTSGGGFRTSLSSNGANPRLVTNSGNDAADISSMSLAAATWNLLVVTWNGSGTARFHLHDGTSWTHANANSGTAAPTTISASDLLRIATRNLAAADFLTADIVCAGIKMSDSSDATVETLSRTSFAAWRSFGFDWLIGFDSSLVSGGVLQDQASPGTGDQTAISGTTVVSDPGGWSWVSAVTPVADFTGTPLSGTAPLSVAFTDSSTNTPTSWAWTFGDGGTSTSQNPTHSYTSPGTYTVSLVATNSAGSNTKTRTGYVVVGGAPVANFTGTPLSGIAPLSVAFTDSSTSSPTSWAWTFGDGGTSSSQNPTHSYTAGGTYTVTLVATNSAGSDTKTRTGYVVVADPIVYAAGGDITVSS